MLRVYEERIEIPRVEGASGLLAHIERAVRAHLAPGLVPVRFVIAETTPTSYVCELGVVAGLSAERAAKMPSIFRFVPRPGEDTSRFNAVLIIPTGIGAEIGGHAGDGNPVSRLLGAICDTLVTHPNVVNASDINDLPPNGLYVEGSVVTRMMMGTAGLEPVRGNRILAVVDEHPDERFTKSAINAVSAARACYGVSTPGVIRLDPPIDLRGVYVSSGRATGQVEQLEGLLDVLDEYAGQYDAVALSTVVQVPSNYHGDYYAARGEMVNPWGGAEALLTHTLSLLYDIPMAHGLMCDNNEVASLEFGIVEPRMAAEEISYTYFMCVLNGLRRSPRIVTDLTAPRHGSILTAENVSCLVIPDKCVGLPTLAALEHGIPVIAVRENKNVLRNDLAALPWRPGQLRMVENYWEAAGMVAAIKAGIDPTTVRRPIADTVFVQKGNRVALVQSDS